jgi:hypothetical protein
MLKRIWEAWKVVAKKIGDFNARVILTVFYFILLAPLAFVIRKNDPMGIRKNKKQEWLTKTPPQGSALDRAIQQS